MAADPLPLRFETRPPPPALAALVREMWHLSDPGAPHRGLPKPYVEIVVSLRGIHWWRAAPGVPEHRYTTAWVTPLQSGARHARAVGRRELIGARLEPWAARAWLGPLPPGDGRPPPTLDTLIGAEARRLREALLTAPDIETRFARFGAWLANQPGLTTAPRLAVRAGEAARAQRLAAAAHLAPRRFRRDFAATAGVAPKRWLLLHRLDAVLRDARLTDPAASLAALAADHGFADQPHLTRELRRFTGAAPGAFRGRGAHYPPHMLGG